MALTKTLAEASIKIENNGVATITKAFNIFEDGEFLVKSQNNVYVAPGDDYSTLGPKVIALLNVAHTQQIIDDYLAEQAT